MSTENGLGVALQTPQLLTTTVSINDFTGDSVTVAYNGLPGNQPNTYKNFIAIWQSTVVPWAAPPLQRLTIPDNAQSGTVMLSDLTITSSTYIVGYGVGPDISDICTTALLSAGGLRAAPTAVEIGIQNIGTTSLAINYSTLSGYLPNTSGNWVGLWKSFVSPYYCPNPVATALVPSDSTEGTVPFNGIQLAINTDYTVIYFMQNPSTPKNNPEAAAILTFSTAQSPPASTPG